MQYLPNIPYPENEKPKLASLESLFREWHLHFASPGSGLEKEADGMVFDGFYPHYLNQRKRILFIGRESREIADHNYIDMMYHTYRESQMIGTKTHLDNSKFHRRMLWIAYGVINGMLAWEDIPEAREIGRTLGEANGVSFAFMNISKLSNEGETSDKADWRAINSAYARSTQGRNFIQEEVAILEPDIVITMSLLDNLADGLESLGKSTWIPDSPPQASSYWLEIKGHRCLLIDTWHFAARNKNDENAHFYAPICEAIGRSEATSASAIL